MKSEKSALGMVNPTQLEPRIILMHLRLVAFIRANVFDMTVPQLGDGAASGSNQASATLNSGAATEGNGYQTLALLPNESGGYVLIVQPQDGKWHQQLNANVKWP